jgi:hypothetical protein
MFHMERGSAPEAVSLVNRYDDQPMVTLRLSNMPIRRLTGYSQSRREDGRDGERRAVARLRSNLPPSL